MHRGHIVTTKIWIYFSSHQNVLLLHFQKERNDTVLIHNYKILTKTWSHIYTFVWFLHSKVQSACSPQDVKLYLPLHMRHVALFGYTCRDNILPVLKERQWRPFLNMFHAPDQVTSRRCLPTANKRPQKKRTSCDVSTYVTWPVLLFFQEAWRPTINGCIYS